jgi:hypothetical protein
MYAQPKPSVLFIIGLFGLAGGRTLAGTICYVATTGNDAMFSGSHSMPTRRCTA